MNDEIKLKKNGVFKQLTATTGPPFPHEQCLLVTTSESTTHQYSATIDCCIANSTMLRFYCHHVGRAVLNIRGKAGSGLSRLSKEMPLKCNYTPPRISLSYTFHTFQMILIRNILARVGVFVKTFPPPRLSILVSKR